MHESEVEAMAAFERTYWWHVARRDLVARLLRAHLPPVPERLVLDVGCGTGGNLELLREFGRVRGVEPAGPSLAHCRARGLGPDVVLEGGADALPVADASQDLVCLLDVLEHLDDDARALRELARVLRPGGHLLLTVPAYRFLWSIHDESLGHRRRYMASEVHHLLNAAGFSLVRRTYAISLPLPAIAGLRIAQGLVPSLYRRGGSYVQLPGLLNRAMVGLLRLEGRVLDAVDIPAGCSIMALARLEPARAGGGRP